MTATTQKSYYVTADATIEGTDIYTSTTVVDLKVLLSLGFGRFTVVLIVVASRIPISATTQIPRVLIFRLYAAYPIPTSYSNLLKRKIR